MHRLSKRLELCDVENGGTYHEYSGQLPFLLSSFHSKCKHTYLSFLLEYGQEI